MHSTKGQAPSQTVLSDLDGFAQGIGGSAETKTSLLPIRSTQQLAACSVPPRGSTRGC